MNLEDLPKIHILIRRLDSLFREIDSFPYPRNIRTLIKYTVASEYFDAWQFDDEVNDCSYRTFIKNPEDPTFRKLKFTEGIVNAWQVNRYLYEFIDQLKQVHIQSLEDVLFPHDIPFLDEFRLPYAEKKEEFKRQFYSDHSELRCLTKTEALKQLGKIIGPEFKEMSTQNIQARNKHMPDPISITNELLKSITFNLLLVDELEIMLCNLVHDRMLFCNRRNLRVDYEPTYYDIEIQTTLFIRFKKRLREIINSVDSEKSISYLILSKNQFFTHDPEKKFFELKDRIIALYRYPETWGIPMNSSSIEHAEDILRIYTKHYWSFYRHTERMLSFYQERFMIADFHANNLNDPQKMQMFSSGKLLSDLNLLNSRSSDTLLSGEIGPISQFTFSDTTPKKFANNSFTYIYNSRNHTAIYDLLDVLLKHRLLNSQTVKRDFKLIFENKIPSKPLQWTGSLSELAYLVKLLHNEYKVIQGLGNNIWKITAQLFVDSEGHPYYWKRFKGQKKPTRAELIENAASKLIYGMSSKS